VWGGSLHNNFVWDDEEQIVANQNVHSLVSLPDLWRGSTFNSGGSAQLSGMYYKPMMSSMFALLYTLGDGEPELFHIVQMLLHIINAIMLYWVMKKILRHDLVAWVIAMIFLVHPVNVETTVYISALQDTMSFTWGILGLVLLMGRKKIILTAVLLLLSLFTKETGILWMAIAGWYLVCFDQKRLRDYILLSLAVLGVYVYLRLGVAHVGLSKHGLAAISTMSWGDRMLSMPKIVMYYISLVVWPANLTIAEHWVVTSASARQFWWPLLGVVVIILGGYIIGKILKWSRVYIFFVGWTGVGLLLHLQFFPLDMTVADRWLYVPLAGMLGMVGVMVVKYRQLLTNEVLLVLGIVVIALSARTIVRINQWESGLALYSHDVLINPAAFDLQNNLGVELYRIGRYNEARKHFETSIELSPTWWTSYNNLGAYWEQNGELERAAVLYKKAIENGQYYLAYENYARVLLKMGREREAKEFLEQSLQYFPGNMGLRGLYQLLDRRR
jgi:hypothetical protein